MNRKPPAEASLQKIRQQSSAIIHKMKATPNLQTSPIKENKEKLDVHLDDNLVKYIIQNQESIQTLLLELLVKQQTIEEELIEVLKNIKPSSLNTREISKEKVDTSTVFIPTIQQTDHKSNIKIDSVDGDTNSVNESAHLLKKLKGKS